jgi:hypothetical protein
MPALLPIVEPSPFASALPPSAPIAPSMLHERYALGHVLQWARSPRDALKAGWRGARQVRTIWLAETMLTLADALTTEIHSAMSSRGPG